MRKNSTIILHSTTKKSQSTAEFLTILAVVLVLSIILINAIGGFQIIGGKSIKRTNDLGLRTQPLGISNYAVTPISIYFILKNNIAEPVQLTNITMLDQNCTLYPANLTIPVDSTREVNCQNVSFLGVGEYQEILFSMTWVGLVSNTTFTSYAENGDYLKLMPKITEPICSLLGAGNFTYDSLNYTCS